MKKLIVLIILLIPILAIAKEPWDRSEKLLGLSYIALTAVDHGIATHELRRSGNNDNIFLMKSFKTGRSSGAHIYRAAETLSVFYILDILPKRFRRIGLYFLCGCRMLWIEESSHRSFSAKIRF